MKRILCIIDSEKADTLPFKAVERVVSPGSTSSEIAFLVFAEDPDGGIRDRLDAAFPGSGFFNPARLLADVYEDTRRSLEVFVARLRRDLTALVQTRCGRESADRFGHLWWYSKLAERNLLGESEWWHLFRFNAVKAAFEQGNYDSCCYVGSDALGGLMEQYCRDKGVGWKAQIVSVMKKKSIARLLKERFRRLQRFAFSSKLARKAVPETGRGADTILVSGYSRMWANRFGRRGDIYYGSFPEALTDADADISWLLNVQDNTDQGVSRAEYADRLAALAEEGLGPFLVAEGLLSHGSMVRGFCRMRDVLDLKRIRGDSAFYACFDWDGVNVSRLLAPLLDYSVFVLWPQYECVEAAYARMAERLNPRRVFLYTFEYLWGRAWMNGVRKGAPDCEIIGLQHGPAAALFLFSGDRSDLIGDHPIPLPDRFVVDGEIAAGLLRSRGVEPSRVMVPGAVRFDPLWRHTGTEHVESREVSVCRVLIAPGLHDTDFVVGFALAALRDVTGIEIVIRPHPKVTDKYVRNVLRRLNFSAGSTVRLEREGDIYGWMRKSDLFISTSSSTGVECLAFGIPTLLLLSRRTPDLSLFRAAGAPVLAFDDAAALREAVQRLAADPEERAAYFEGILPTLERSFGAPDGEASVRLVGMIAEDASEEG